MAVISDMSMAAPAPSIMSPIMSPIMASSCRRLNPGTSGELSEREMRRDTVITT